MFQKKEKRGNKSEGMSLLVIGLGNPGRKYSNTRHNIGAKVVTDLAKKLKLSFKKGNGFYVWCCISQKKRKKLILTKTTTFMNLTGKAVVQMISEFGIPPKNCIAVVDDVALPLGKLRLRLSGSDGGHRGLASMIAEMGTKEFPRLRFGIGNPQIRDMRLEDFVLQVFSSEEKEKVNETRKRAVEAILFIKEYGIEKAMNYVNRREIQEVRNLETLCTCFSFEFWA